ncbi:MULTISPECIES: hypothetical protein [Pseudomonas]|uniref:Uncharacterized protein n=1 Tax=Pseudomonas fluorescens TaxID=294 RepID=A0A7Z3C483_PSEFL|nr:MULTISPECIES: hypothetical protein [Pseudomonas]QJP95225.1 hypothetical protein C6Y56_11640 [Pseudomonas fluorescens]
MTQKTPAFRSIKSHEETLSATEIVERFEAVTGCSLHPTNAGNAAKVLGLDYIEVKQEVTSGVWTVQKRYSILDIDFIFERLKALADNRARYQ